MGLIELNHTAGPDDSVTKQTRIVEPWDGRAVGARLKRRRRQRGPFTDTLMVAVMTSREAREQLGH
jgi:hypothetical protein